ncbi:DNA-binding response regulator, NarL/FixJ family, contains REC and HTH domains [Rhizobium sp. NFR07]|uniref:helix-turn-helix transcriptional regulator n=1 Tax=Rhizobium sp. NFR07 TaxID=1566262 RepID=UPI0008E888F9|nr:response regulator transcription factor [Rhizobium sp. NFR07]SFA78726.1 DNA-binding response regulator, NarL/FixJ family, contains REC and HTH domains [Rhizobium sp. NFR07]
MDTKQQIKSGLVVLIDGLAMRRACMLSALEPWADGQDLSLTSYAPNDVMDLRDDDDIRLVLINTGGASLAETEQHELLLSAKAAFSGPCAIISDRTDPDDAVSAAEMGFQAFLPAILPLDIVKQALIFIMNGGTYFPREALLATLSMHARMPGRHRSTDGSSPNLTQRQTEVLERLRFGRSNKHIARELNMQEATVKVHVRQIMRKLGAANRTQAALLAQSQTSSQSPYSSVAEDPSDDMSSIVLSRKTVRPEASEIIVGL